MKICAIVPTYNRKKLLAGCLEALLKQTRPLDEVLVVDNGSNDGTAEMVEQRFGARVSTLRLSENTGSAGGFYEGMRWAWERGHDWIWCMDNDAAPAEDCLQNLLDAPCPPEVPIVARLCARRDPETGKPYAEAGMLDIPHHTQWNLCGKDWSHWDGRVLPVDVAPWGGLLVEARAARGTNGHWRDLFTWFDDYVFSYELRKTGRILFVADAQMTHPPHRTRSPLELKHGERLVAQQFWKAYYDFRNAFGWERLEFGAWNTWRRYLLRYLRYLVGILLFDDFKMYRMGIRTRAMMDIALGRWGQRVHPGEFERRYGSRADSRPSASAG
jgi:GT2 family glycosyltransferase